MKLITQKDAENFNCMFLAVEQHTKKKMNNYQEEEVEIVPNAWSSELPMDLLGLITVKIRSSFPLPEFIRFGSVCLGWRSFSIENYQHIKLPDKVPLLIIPIPPSSLLLTDHHHHHQKMTPSSPSSSSSLCDDDEEEEEEGEEEHEAAEEEKEPEEKEPEEEPEELCDDEEEEELCDDDEEEEHNAAEEEKDSDEDSDEESEEVVVRVVVKTKKYYYNPKDIWEGQDDKQRHRSVRNFYSLSEKMVYHDFPLPVPYYKNIRGSSHGWLVTVEECWGEDNGLEPYLPVRLFNPFRTDNNEIQLPPITSGNPGNLYLGERISSSCFLKKAFLSANPSSLSDPTTQLVVLGVYGRYRLAFCRPGDKSWTRLDLDDYRPIQDVICYDDQFYAILQSGYVFAFVFDSAQPFLTPIVTEEFSPPKEDSYPPRKGTPTRYLVESEGDLLQVQRNIGILSLQESLEEIGFPTPIECDGYITRQFLVFKLDPIGRQWVEMKTLNDHMIFIGNNSSMSISALDFPGWSRPNSIYYTDDYDDGFNYNPQSGPHDIGVFNMEDGSFERHYEAESKTIMPPPIWIQPML